MTDIDEARKRLEAGLDNNDWCFCVSPGGQAFTDVRAVLDALDAAIAEKDRWHNAAILSTAQEGKLREERDEALAVIERAKAVLDNGDLVVALQRGNEQIARGEVTRRERRPADVLRAAKEEAFSEGWRRGFTDGFKNNTDLAENPYREKEEQD